MSRPKAALAEGGGAGGAPGAAAEAGRWRRGPLPPEEPAEMLAENLVEEFEMKEDEPWYDHRDLQQGEGAVAPRVGGLAREVPGRETVKKLVSLAAGGRQVREGPALTWRGDRQGAQPTGRPLPRSDHHHPCVWGANCAGAPLGTPPRLAVESSPHYLEALVGPFPARGLRASRGAPPTPCL